MAGLMQGPAARNVAPLTVRQHPTHPEIAFCKTSHGKTSPAAEVFLHRKLNSSEYILALLVVYFYYPSLAEKVWGMNAQQGSPVGKGESLSYPNHYIRDYLCSRSEIFRELVRVQVEASLRILQLLNRWKKKGIAKTSQTKARLAAKSAAHRTNRLTTALPFR